jgi:DNA uptake protein ComE-like DNA-binding protein
MTVSRAALAVVVATALAGWGCGPTRSGGADHGGTRSSHVELNTAARKDLAALPGLTKADADHIIAGRPYTMRRELVGKQILTDAQFEKVKDLVYVEHERRD